MKDTLLFLVRHGQTAWNVERRFQGQLDVPLSPQGLTQAQSLARWLGQLTISFSAIHSSNLRRAAETTSEIARELEIEPVYSGQLRELHAGDWQGMTVTDVEETFPGQLRLWREDAMGFTIPGGESLPSLQQRMAQYIATLQDAYKGEAIIVVSHGAALATYLAAANGWNLQETWDSHRARMSNTGVTVLLFPESGKLPTTLLADSLAHLDAYTHLPSVIDAGPGEEMQAPATELAV